MVGIGFSPDSKTVLTTSLDHTARLWEAGTGRPRGQPLQHQGPVVRGTFSRDGRLVLTGSEDGTARLWNAATGEIAGWPLRHRLTVHAAVFSPDGRLALTGSKDGMARLWDVATSRPVGPPRILRGAVRAVMFHPDGRQALAVDEFGDVGAWPIPLPHPDRNDLDLQEQAWQVRSGLEINIYQEVVSLETETWCERRHALGGHEPAMEPPDDRLSGHDAAARDAESLGNGFAASWHLDRLIAARPDDGLPHARYARMLARFGRGAEADSEWSRALELGPRDRVLDWTTQVAAVDHAEGRLDDALSWLNRLVRERPDDWTLYAARAGVFAGLGESRRRADDLERAIALGADVAFLVRLAEEHARAAPGSRPRCSTTGRLSRGRFPSRSGIKSHCPTFSAATGTAIGGSARNCGRAIPPPWPTFGMPGL